jgi:hypothetical protein
MRASHWCCQRPIWASGWRDMSSPSLGAIVHHIKKALPGVRSSGQSAGLVPHLAALVSIPRLFHARQHSKLQSSRPFTPPHLTPHLCVCVCSHLHTPPHTCVCLFTPRRSRSRWSSASSLSRLCVCLFIPPHLTPHPFVHTLQVEIKMVFRQHKLQFEPPLEDVRMRHAKDFLNTFLGLPLRMKVCVRVCVCMSVRVCVCVGVCAWWYVCVIVCL